ncbi:hypothetical protein LCI18_002991 [Fusarium solani-melongenae]|uniref:Uncharacterized protein n=1 Tax=Fusarium solani subsp. cucurbitae TaxID=2747967 RepID=A0ACD3YT37_FUSSC|nr:hypothetical protein LCI18_002991 [Fusarium solani-melongenae]
MKWLTDSLKSCVKASHGPENTGERATLNTTPTAVTDAESETTSRPKETQQADDCRLECLPPEVRRYILSILDLSNLSALVHASPTFHQQYLVDRRYLLCKSLEATIGCLTVEAYAVHRLYAPRNTSDFLEWYSEKCSQRAVAITDDLTEGVASTIAGFYLRSVKPVVEDCARRMLDNLAKSAGNNHGDQQKIQPSRTEMMRLTRAAYRFQLLCQLTSPERTSRSSAEENLLALLNIIEPWEIEELFAFYQFALDVYDKVFTDIYWDLHPDNPKFDDQGRPPTPDGAFDLDSGFVRDKLLEGTAIRGLTFLHTVLFQINEHEHLVSTMQNRIQSSYIPIDSMVGIFAETQQIIRRQEQPSERDQMEVDRVPLVFVRDELDRPPRAWTMIWGDTYSNVYGLHIPDEMRDWGYVFWDEATLERTGGAELLRRQWEECWGDYDPREDFVRFRV